MRRDALNLRVTGKRPERLFLERRKPPVPLVAAGLIRAARPQNAIVRSRERHVVDRRDAAPHIHELLARRLVGDRVNQPDLRWQRHRDPDETVLAEIAEVARVVAVDPEIVRIDRPEQGIVGIGIPSQRHCRNWKRASALAGDSWKLSVGMWQSAHARPFPCRPSKFAVEEREQAASDAITGLSAAGLLSGTRAAGGCGLGGAARGIGPHQQRRDTGPGRRRRATMWCFTVPSCLMKREKPVKS